MPRTKPLPNTTKRKKGAHRTKEARLEDDARLMQMARHGFSRWTMALELGISEMQVSVDIRRITATLKQETTAEAAAIREVQMERLNAIYEEAILAWQRSKRDGEEESETEKQTSADLIITKSKKRYGRTGNPEYLQAALNAINQIRDLWGLDPPKEEHVSGVINWDLLHTKLPPKGPVPDEIEQALEAARAALPRPRDITAEVVVEDVPPNPAG